MYNACRYRPSCGPGIDQPRRDLDGSLTVAAYDNPFQCSTLANFAPAILQSSRMGTSTYVMPGT